MKAWVLAISIIAAGWCPQEAAALSGLARVSAEVGSCYVLGLLEIEGELNIGYVVLADADLRLVGGSGGTYWNNNAVLDSSAGQITSDDLTGCLGGGLPITNFSQNGATGASLIEDDYVGFSFDAGGIHYEYALKGATNTVWVATQSAANTAPDANAGVDQLANSDDFVELDGSASSDAEDGQALTYAWTQTAGTTVTLSDASIASPNFTAPTLNEGDADVSLTFSLVVTDSKGLPSVADTVTVTVWAPTPAPENTAPVANAGADQLANSDDFVELDGSASSDAEDGQALTYAWTQESGPTVTLSGASTASPTFTAPTLNEGDADVSLTFSLAVIDSLGSASVADTVTVTVLAPASEPEPEPAPTVAVPDAPATTDGSGPFTATIHFDQVVTGFDASDVGVTNGTLISLVPRRASAPRAAAAPAVASADYIATIQPNGAGDVVITIAAGAAQTLSGVPSLAMTPVTVALTAASDDQASETIASFMVNRANHLVVNQPELSHFLMGGGAGHLDAQVSKGQASLDFASDPSKPIWFTVKGAKSSDSNSTSDYVLGVVGSHVAVQPNLLIGAMLQFDSASERKGAAKTSGTGWLAGPYLVTRMNDQPLVFEARALFGQTSNTVSPLGTYEDRFKTNRALIQAALTGEIIKGDTTYKPRFGLTSTSDRQQAYVDSNGTTIAEQQVNLTEVEAGLSIEQAITTAQGQLVLKGGLTGIWAQTSGSGATVVADYEGGRAKVELGAELAASQASTLSFTSYYDGLGTTSYEDWGLGLNWETKF